MLKFVKEFSIQEIETGTDSSITDSILSDLQFADDIKGSVSDEVTLSYPPSYTTVGCLADENGIVEVVKNKVQYVKTNRTFNFSQADSWAIITKMLIIDEGDYSDNGLMALVDYINSKKSVNSFLRKQGKICYNFSSDGSNMNIGTIVPTNSVPFNTWFYIKCEFTGTEYNLYQGLALDSLELQGTVNKSTKVYNVDGVYTWGRDATKDQTIVSAKYDMSECKIIINDEVVWQGSEN